MEKGRKRNEKNVLLFLCCYGKTNERSSIFLYFLDIDFLDDIRGAGKETKLETRKYALRLFLK